jgi:hypothetical protein
MRNKLRALIALAIIHRANVPQVVRSYRAWKGGRCQVFDLRGQIHP